MPFINLIEHFEYKRVHLHWVEIWEHLQQRFLQYLLHEYFVGSALVRLRLCVEQLAIGVD